jgi:hypothetical protein
MMIEEFWTEAEAEAEAASCNIVLLSCHDGFHDLTTQQFERLSQFHFLYFSCVRLGCEKGWEPAKNGNGRVLGNPNPLGPAI